MRRATAWLVLLGAPCVASEPVPRARLGFEVGPALVRYSEGIDASTASRLLGVAADIDGSSTTVGFLGRADGALRLGADLEATLDAVVQEGVEADMEYREQGQTFQRNRFRMEWVEGGPGLAWRIQSPGDGPAWWFTMGYRFTWQRLHILDVPDVGDATELLLVHAFPLGGSIVWGEKSVRLAVPLHLGPTYTRTTNDRITGVVFYGSGFLVDLGPRIGCRVRPGWVTLGLLLDVRWQAGSGIQEASLQGSRVNVIWPSNTTFVMLGSIGFATEWPSQ
jgi:hypothetical protein